MCCKSFDQRITKRVLEIASLIKLEKHEFYPVGQFDSMDVFKSKILNNQGKMTFYNKEEKRCSPGRA